MQDYGENGKQQANVGVGRPWSLGQSILSPVLFSIKINNIIKQVAKGTDASLFVDDFAIYIRGSRLPFLERTLQLCLNNVNNWVSKNGFKFSASKTKCLHFTRSRDPSKPHLYLGDTEIEVVEEFKFLGLIFDKRMTFKSHVLHLKKKCQKALDILRVVGHTDWGADKVTLLRLYRALVRSKLDYGCIVYGSASRSVLKLLDPIHHQGLRIALGAFRTSPVASLYAEAKEPSLANRRLKLTLNYVLKLKSCPDNPAYNCVFNPPDTELFEPASLTPPLGVRIKDHLENAEINIKSVQTQLFTTTPPWCLHEPKVDLTLTCYKKETTNPVLYKQRFLEHRENYSDYLQIYTDGSKVEEKSAAAAVVRSHTRVPTSCRLPDHCSIYTAELKAIILALKHVYNIEDSNKFLILSDSLSALQALKNLKTDHPFLACIHEILSTLRKKNKQIVFMWIPGHVNIRGNETADRLAKMALEKDPLKSDVPFTDLKPLVNHYLFSTWQNEWDEQVQNKLHAILPRLDETLPSFCKSRKEQSVLSRLRIGHTFLTHGFILRREDPPFCFACDEVITVEHILLKCADLIETRESFYNVRSLYELFRTVPCALVCEFLREIGIFGRV